MLVLSSHVFFNVRSVNRIVENSVATSVIANLQFFPPLLFQIQDFTTRVRLQDYSIVFGDQKFNSKNHSAKFLFSPIDQLLSLLKVNSEICFHCVKVNHHIV